MRRIVRFSLIGLSGLLLLVGYFLYPPAPRDIHYPDGKRFAFSIVDDSDLATLERVRPVYEVLHRNGVRTTKTVWVFPTNNSSHETNQGDSLADPDYRDFIIELQSKGFEIALHGVRGGSSPRAQVIAGLDEFKRVLGHDPTMQVNHSLNRDNVYWGAARWSSPPLRWLYSLITEREFDGENPESPYFWGDELKARIKYVNQFTFGNINLLNITPSIPYRLTDRPLVKFWFPTADGDNLDRFLELLSPHNLDRLEREGGLCLVFAHMGAGSFNRGSGVDPRFEARIKDLASRNGWFAPASEILDYLQQQPGFEADLDFREAVRLDILFLWNYLRRG